MSNDNNDIEMGVVNMSTKSHHEKCETNDWNFGCCRLNKYCVQYFAQLGVLSVCIAVSLFQVSTKSENRDFWIGLLSSSIGILIPSPKLKK